MGRPRKVVEEIVEEKQEFVILNKDGVEVRRYTVEIHGDKASEYAANFCAKFGYTLQ